MAVWDILCCDNATYAIVADGEYPQTLLGGAQTPRAGSPTPPDDSQTPPAGSQTPQAGPQTPPAGAQAPPGGPWTPPAGPRTPPAVPSRWWGSEGQLEGSESQNGLDLMAYHSSILTLFYVIIYHPLQS